MFNVQQWQNMQLWSAINNNDPQNVKELLEGSPPADPNYIYADTPTLNFAISKGNIEICELFAQHKANLNLTDNKKFNAVHQALLCSRTDIAMMLLNYANHNKDHPLDLEHFDFEGVPVLHKAVILGDEPLVRKLRELGCTDSSTNQCDSADDIARNSSNPIMVSLLKELQFPMPPKYKLFQKKGELLKKAGHLLGLSQEIVIDRTVHDKPTLTEGNTSLKSVTLLDGIVKRYIKNPNPFKPTEKLDPKTAKQFSEISQTIENSKKYLQYDESMTAEMMAENFKKGQYVQVPSGWVAHDIGVLLHKNKFGGGGKLVLENRGAGKLLPASGTLIYEISADKMALIDANFIQGLRPSGVRKDSKFIMDLIGQVVDINRPLIALPSKAQKHGTCSYVNEEEAIRAMLFLQDQETLYDALSSSEKIMMTDLNPIVVHQAINSSQEKFKDFSNAERNFGVFDLVRGAKGEKLSKDDVPEGTLLAEESEDIAAVDTDFYLQILEKYLLEHHGQEKQTGFTRTVKVNQELEREEYILESLPDASRKHLVEMLNQTVVSGTNEKGVDLLTPAIMTQKEKLIDVLVQSGASTSLKTMHPIEKMMRGADQQLAKKVQQFAKNETMIFSDMQGPKTMEDVEEKVRVEKTISPNVESEPGEKNRPRIDVDKYPKKH